MSTFTTYANSFLANVNPGKAHKQAPNVQVILNNSNVNVQNSGTLNINNNFVIVKGFPDNIPAVNITDTKNEKKRGILKKSNQSDHISTADSKSLAFAKETQEVISSSLNNFNNINTITVTSQFKQGREQSQDFHRSMQSSEINALSNSPSRVTERVNNHMEKDFEDLNSPVKNRRERMDRRGVAITKNGKKHKVTFLDKIGGKGLLIEKIDVESYKKYNISNTFAEGSGKDSSSTSCCVIM